jgi:hypothetical protein
VAAFAQSASTALADPGLERLNVDQVVVVEATDALMGDVRFGVWISVPSLGA